MFAPLVRGAQELTHHPCRAMTLLRLLFFFDILFSPTFGRGIGPLALIASQLGKSNSGL